MKRKRQPKSATGVDSKIPDIPGQLGLNTRGEDVYCEPPDEACVKNAKPLEKPPPPPKTKHKIKRRIFNLQFNEKGDPIRMPDNQFEEYDCD